MSWSLSPTCLLAVGRPPQSHKQGHGNPRPPVGLRIPDTGGLSDSVHRNRLESSPTGRVFSRRTLKTSEVSRRLPKSIPAGIPIRARHMWLIQFPEFPQFPPFHSRHAHVVDAFRAAFPGDVVGSEPAVRQDTGEFSWLVVVGLVAEVLARQRKPAWGETIGEQYAAGSEQVFANQSEVTHQVRPGHPGG